MDELLANLGEEYREAFWLAFYGLCIEIEDYADEGSYKTAVTFCTSPEDTCWMLRKRIRHSLKRRFMLA
jgi:hypothetical protein